MAVAVALAVALAGCGDSDGQKAPAQGAGELGAVPAGMTAPPQARICSTIGAAG